MNANELAQAVADDEGLKKPTNIAQIKEVLKVANKRVSGALYKAARHVTYEKGASK